MTDTVDPSEALREASYRANLRIGARLCEAREAAGLSREDLAARMNTTAEVISKYERGRYRISAGLLAALAGNFDREIAWFFSKPLEGEHA